MPEQTEHREPVDLEAIRAELRNAAHLEKPAERSIGGLAGQRLTMAWVSLGRHVPQLVDTVESLVRQVTRLEHRYEDRRDELARERGSAAAVARVRRLHDQYRSPWIDDYDVCSHCTRGMDLVRWPCPTIQALNEAMFPADGAAAGGGAGNPATEHQPPPTPTETEG